MAARPPTPAASAASPASPGRRASSAPPPARRAPRALVPVEDLEQVHLHLPDYVSVVEVLVVIGALLSAALPRVGSVDEPHAAIPFRIARPTTQNLPVAHIRFLSCELNSLDGQPVQAIRTEAFPRTSMPPIKCRLSSCETRRRAPQQPVRGC